ncbi:PASTA domain-containing protein, partial [Streptomyces caniscabiei]
MAGLLVLTGCGESAPSLLAVTAVAAGVPSLAPFFDEGERLGRDQPDLRSPRPHSGLQQGSTPGLYGGTREPKICDVGKLEDFLTAPENKKKAQEWARIVGVDVDRIPDYLGGLTPVLLRHDTLVKNHDYKKGRGVPFDALLEAGIAVLVDDQGLPAVKCSCGNPLRSFTADPDRIEVTFGGDNKEWESYDEAAVVVVKPAPEQLKEIKLVDVEDPDRGISRDVGTTGESDTTFDTRARQAVPKVRGMTFGEASAAMAEKGLAVTVAGDEMPPGDAPVTGSSPGPGTELEFGAAVALDVEWPGTASDSGTDGTDGTDTSGSGSGPSGSDGGSGPAGGSTGTDAGPTEPTDPGGSSTDGSDTGGSPSGGSGSDGPSSGGSDSGGSDSGGSDTSGSASGGAPSESSSVPTDPGTTPSDGGSSPTDGVPSPTESTAPPPTGGTSLTPAPSRSSEPPSPDPTPTS